MDMMVKCKRSEQDVVLAEMLMGKKEEGPCPCSSYNIVTFATSSIETTLCFKLGDGL